MMKFTRKQAFAVALSAVFSLAVFSAPLIYATEMPIASAPTESTEPVAPSEPPPAVSETPVVSTPEVSDPTGGVSVPPVVSGEPGGTESGGIEPLPDGSSAPSSEPEGQISEPASSETVSSEEPVESLCAAAAEKGISHLTITDHCECNEFEKDSYGERIDGSFAAAKAQQGAFGDLQILCGVELAQPMQNPEAARKLLSSHAFDFVLGSIHAIR